MDLLYSVASFDIGIKWTCIPNVSLQGIQLCSVIQLNTLKRNIM